METPDQRRLNIHANRYRRKLIEDRKERIRKAEGERMKVERGDTSEMRESQAKPVGTSIELGKLLHVNQEVWS